MKQLNFYKKLPLAILLMTSLGACQSATIDSHSIKTPTPKIDVSTSNKKENVAVLAGGCFWGMTGVFQHVKGVTEVDAGYSGGDASTATYSQVSEGNTGHAESVEIHYNPQQVSYGQLLQIYFSVPIDPTELNRQGPDSGTQYRSVIFYNSPEQEKVAKDYVDQLTKSNIFSAPIVTTVTPLKDFYKAENYHQNYAKLHPDNPYIAYNDEPMIENLKHLFPDKYQE